MSERIRGSYDDALYKSTYTLLLYRNTANLHTASFYHYPLIVPYKTELVFLGCCTRLPVIDKNSTTFDRGIRTLPRLTLSICKIAIELGLRNADRQ